MKSDEKTQKITRLLEAIRARLPELEALYAKTGSDRTLEDGFYRLYHQSYEVYGRLQEPTLEIVAALQSLAPDQPLHDWFMEIIQDGTQRKFTLEVNPRFLAETRPILEAFFHAREFLALVIKYGKKLEAAPVSLSAGWAAVLTLYRLR